MDDRRVACPPAKAKAVMYGGRMARKMRYMPYLMTVEEIHDGAYGFVPHHDEAVQAVLRLLNLGPTDFIPDIYTNVVTAGQAKPLSGHTLLTFTNRGLECHKVVKWTRNTTFSTFVDCTSRELYADKRMTFVRVGIVNGQDTYYALPHPHLALMHLYSSCVPKMPFLKLNGTVVKVLSNNIIRYVRDKQYNTIVAEITGTQPVTGSVYVNNELPELKELPSFHCDLIPQLKEKIFSYLDRWWSGEGRQTSWSKSRQVGVCAVPRGLEFLLHTPRKLLDVQELNYIIQCRGFDNVVGMVRKPSEARGRFVYPMHPTLEAFYREYIGYKSAYLGPFTKFDPLRSPPVKNIYDVVKFDRRFFPYYKAWCEDRSLPYLLPRVYMHQAGREYTGYDHSIPSGFLFVSEVCATITAAFFDYIGATQGFVGGDSFGTDSDLAFFTHRCCADHPQPTWVRTVDNFNGFRYNGFWRFCRGREYLTTPRIMRRSGLNGHALWLLCRWCYERMGDTDLPHYDDPVGKFIPGKSFGQADLLDIGHWLNSIGQEGPKIWRDYCYGDYKLSSFDCVPSKSFKIIHSEDSRLFTLALPDNLQQL